MFIYNETIGIDKSAEEEWLVWVKTVYIPQVMLAGGYVDSRIYKVLHENEDDTVSYSLQYFSTELGNIIRYLEHDGQLLAEAHRKKFEGRHVAFRTLLEEI